MQHTDTARTLPFHTSISNAISLLNPADFMDVTKAKVLRELLDTTTIPPAHFAEVQEAIVNKLASLDATGGQYAGDITKEVDRAKAAVTWQMEQHARRQNGRGDETARTDVDPALAAAKIDGDRAGNRQAT